MMFADDTNLLTMKCTRTSGIVLFVWNALSYQRTKRNCFQKLPGTAQDRIDVEKRLARARTVWAKLSASLGRLATKNSHKGLLIKAAPQNSLLFGAEVRAWHRHGAGPAKPYDSWSPSPEGKRDERWSSDDGRPAEKAKDGSDLDRNSMETAEMDRAHCQVA